MPPRRRTGLSRLTRYLDGRWGVVALLLLAAVGEAAAQTGGWLLVRDAINNGVAKGDESFLAKIGEERFKVVPETVPVRSQVKVGHEDNSCDPGRHCFQCLRRRNDR